MGLEFSFLFLFSFNIILFSFTNSIQVLKINPSRFNEFPKLDKATQGVIIIILFLI